MSLVRRLARPMLASIFVSGGIGQLKAPEQHAEMGTAVLRPVADFIAGSTGFRPDPQMLVKLSGMTMVGAGTMLGLGRMPRLSSTVLAASLVPTTLAGHAFWAEKDPQARRLQQIQFMKNLGLAGGALLAAVDTEGRPGLAHRAGSARRGLARDAARTVRVTRREARMLAKQAALEARLAQAKLS